MQKALAGFVILFATAAFGADNPIDRWATALGGREKLANVTAVYREATMHVGEYDGWLKAWHTADGKYRKDEQVAAFSNVEVFDGTSGTIQRGPGAARAMEGPEIARAKSSAYANWNAAFFVFFPERRHGTVTVEGDDTIVLHPDGGIDWRIVLDPKTSLPKTMTHTEGERTITVTFAGYETIDGIQFEREIHRSNGDPRFDAVIRFTKTVVNPAVDASLFSVPTQ